MFTCLHLAEKYSTHIVYVCVKERGKRDRERERPPPQPEKACKACFIFHEITIIKEQMILAAKCGASGPSGCHAAPGVFV